MIPLPQQKYKIIYADQAWAYNESGSGNRVVHSKYPTMQVEEIEQLPVKDIADDNCILFIWVTFPRLKEGLRVIESWGFKYVGLGFNWIKKNKKSDSLFWGMGYYTRQNPEICLIGRKGKVTPLVRNIHSVIQSPIQEHSRKPDIIRNLIVKICGDVKRIELFARQKVDGWDCWGNEIDNNTPTQTLLSQSANAENIIAVKQNKFSEKENLLRLNCIH